MRMILIGRVAVATSGYIATGILVTACALRAHVRRQRLTNTLLHNMTF